jgi:hypothetical protein
MTTPQYQIEQINYDLISKLTNISTTERSLLFGNSNKYVAVKRNGSTCEVLLDTIGKRDECANRLKQILSR